MILLASLFNAKMFIPGVFFAVAASLGAAFMMLKRANQKISFKVFVIYSLVTILVYALCGLIGFLEFKNPTLMFIITQALFVIMGIIHFVFITRLIKASHDEDNFWQELIFTLYVGCVGAFAFQAVFSFTNNVDFGLLFASAQFMFLLPFLLLNTAQRAVSIPQKIYKKWYYPTDPSEMEVSDDIWSSGNTVFVKFVLTHSPENPEEQVLTGQVPQSLEFGLFFANLLADWNDRHPGSQIKALDQVNVPYAWNFYIERPGFFGSRDYIDPSMSIRENGISEQDRVIAERV